MFQFKIIQDTIQADFNTHTANCLSQLIHLNREKQIIYLTFFIDATDNRHYNKKKIFIDTLIKEHQLTHVPYSVIAQKPFKNDICVEVAFVNKTNLKLEYKQLDDLCYLVTNNGHYQHVIGFGLTGNHDNHLQKQSETAFKKVQKILQSEGLDFSSVVRQWNYIENITCEFNVDKKLNQHYQIFNDVRSCFYSTSLFNQGYPAATGIGMQSGGVIIDFIAIKPSAFINIVAMVNPNQIDAHKYSENVLVGPGDTGIKTTPKFERAKAIIANNEITIYVSGTAAIQGELTVNSKSVEEQTHETLINIEKLVSTNNRTNHNIPVTENLDCKLLRVYVREGEPIAPVVDIISQNYPNTPLIAVTGNVCRNDLLVEIEGIFQGTRS